MNEHKRYEMLITHTDGSHQRFRFPSQVDALKMSQLVERLLTTPTLSMGLKDRLLVLPTTGIRSVEIQPAPMKLPALVLHEVEYLSATR